MQVVYIEYALLLLYVVFYHYIFALNLEITIKLSRATSQGYKKRVIVYHIISTVLTIILALLLISITYFQTDKEALSLDALGYDILAWYLICISGIVWIFIGIYFKKMIQTKSLGLLNLMILTVIVNIVLILGVVMPEIILYFELDNIVEDKIGWALLVMDGALGFIEFLVLIMNKKFFRFISSVIQQKKDKIVRDSIRKSQDTSRQRISSLLSEINRSDSGLDEDGGLLGDFFDHVTKKAIILIFIVISLRYLVEKLSRKAKKKYNFWFSDLENLFEKVRIEFIKDLSINSLSIVEYFPQSFDRIKQFYSNSDILASLLSPYNYKNLINLIQEKGGNSEAFIFSTYDEKFILKTITKAERKFFVSKLLPNYLERLEKAPQSNLVRILGVFKIYPLRQSVMIMENLIYAKKECVIFDLKGSKVARLVKGIENPRKPPTGIVLKDENFFLFNWKIKLAEDLKKKVLGTLIKDFNSLKECGVTDYSLILAIYSKSFNEKVLGRNVIIADDGTRFCIGIIDILQEYNFTKASEKMIKSIFEKEELISAAEPEDYFNRIAGFVSSIFE